MLQAMKENQCGWHHWSSSCWRQSGERWGNTKLGVYTSDHAPWQTFSSCLVRRQCASSVVWVTWCTMRSSDWRILWRAWRESWQGIKLVTSFSFSLLLSSHPSLSSPPLSPSLFLSLLLLRSLPSLTSFISSSKLASYSANHVPWQRMSGCLIVIGHRKMSGEC